MSLTPGTRLGPYQIIAPLGAGGMGEVYRARDPRLGREVALKVLPAALTSDPERLRRFEQEARAASALNHPNILTVHDIGSHEQCPYLVTELLHGKTLRELLLDGPLPVDRVMAYARQLATGLAAAHDRGIIHRDLKPENTFVTDDGRLKILDFGLAKLRLPAPAAGEAATSPAASTETGIILGSMGYMSPEQAEGSRVDHRTDLFSLGAVLFELVTGRQAFEGAGLAALVAVVHEDPPSASTLRPEVPARFAQVIHQCLAKDPAERFQSAGELLTALERQGSAGDRRRGPKRTAAWVIGALLLLVGASIAVGIILKGPGSKGARSSGVAVLPFGILGDTVETGYLAEGLTDGLIAELAEIGALKVISRSSGALAQGMAKPLHEVARELGVEAMVRGSLRRDGDTLRVSVSLLRPAAGAAPWTQDYAARLDQLPQLQREITLALADQLKAELKRDEREHLATGPQVDRRAYEAYLRGRFHMERGELEPARALFEQARTAAPAWAPPYVGLANYYTTLPFFSDIPPVDVLPKAREALVKALELEETLAEAHATLAYIRAYYEWDWRAAQQEFQRAIELRPNYADAHFSYSRFLASRGRLDEAVAQIRHAMELDPLSLALQGNIALLHYFAGRYGEALAQLQATLRTDSTNVLAQWGMALVKEQLGKPAEAIAILEPISGSSLNRRSSLGHAYAIAGKALEARAILDTLQARAARSYVPSYYFALVHAGLGELEEALQWLERAYQERSTVLAYIRIDPRLRPLHEHPRFKGLLQRMGGE